MADMDWEAWAKAYVASQGLGDDLANDVVSLVNQGFKDEALVYQLRTTSTAYKEKFPAINTMLAKGRTEKDYLSFYASMKELEAQYGLAPGVLSSVDQVKTSIEKNLDEAQIQKRVMINDEAARGVPQEVRDAMAQYYGVTDVQGALTTYYLDPTKGLSFLEQQLATAKVGGTATQRGFALQQKEAERLASFGASYGQVQQNFDQAALLRDATTGPGSVVSQEDLIAAQFGSTDAAEKLQRAVGQRQAAFKGGGGAATDRSQSGAPGGAGGLGSASQ